MKKCTFFICSALFFVLIIISLLVNLDSYNTKEFNVYTISELIEILENRNVKINESDKYEVSVLIELIDSPKENNDLSTSHISISNRNIDDALIEHRNKVKSLYLNYNNKSALELDLEKYNYYVSFYSPYIEILFDDIYEYLKYRKELLSTLCKSNLVLSVSSYVLVDEKRGEATVDTSDYSTDYPLIDAFEDIGVLDSSYTGEGVRVGILDTGIPYTYNLKPNMYTIIFATQEMHSTVITSIIGGTSGIAEDVFFVCKGAKNTRSLFSDCELLINDYNVNIINISLNYDIVGKYTNYDACIDTIISNTGCTIVKSAGNEGDESDYITAPGCAMNVITVGSINKSKNVHSDSSWNTTESFLMKPDVVAPGGQISDIPNIENVYSGTSYAAPMVVGTIALLMEEFPELVINPALVKSVLHLGAEKLPSQVDYYDDQSGFGLINYQNMRNCLSSQCVDTFDLSDTTTTNGILSSHNISLSYWDKIIIHSNTIINSSINQPNDTNSTPEYTDYSINIFNIETSTYVATSTVDSNIDYLIFINDNRDNTSFRIDIVLENNDDSIFIPYCAIAYQLIPHEHNYNYEYYNTTQHIYECECETGYENHEIIYSLHNFSNHKIECKCGYSAYVNHNFVYLPYQALSHKSLCDECGYFRTEPHITSVSISNGKICIKCFMNVSSGGGGNQYNSVTGITYITEGGSYVRADGIIVLSETDYMLYLSGELDLDSLINHGCVTQ